VSEPWRVHAVDEETLILRAPDGSFHLAECPNGRLDLEAEDAFFPMRHTGLVPGALADSGFGFEFPDDLRGQPAIQGDRLWGFRLTTPRSYTLDLIFTREKPPLDLARTLTALTERKESDDGTRKLRHQPVPAEQGRPAPEGAGELDADLDQGGEALPGQGHGRPAQRGEEHAERSGQQQVSTAAEARRRRFARGG